MIDDWLKNTGWRHRNRLPARFLAVRAFSSGALMFCSRKRMLKLEKREKMGRVKRRRGRGREERREKKKHGSNLQQPYWFFVRNQSNRTIFDPPNKPGWIYKRLPNQAIRNGSDFTSTIPHSFALAPTLRVTIFTLPNHLRHNKDGGYNITNINKQLSPAQNRPARA